MDRPDVTDADVGWLAGLIDSESTVSLTTNTNGSPVLRIQIYNSSDLILDKAAKVLHGLGVKWSERADRRAPRTGYVLAVSTAGCLSMYERVRPHMVRHANRYDAAYWFIAPRLGAGKKVMWTTAEREQWANLREVLNAR